MENKPLIIPQSKSWRGLKVFCYECGTTIGDICKATGKPVTQCKHGDKHVFKVVVHVPGTKNQRRTKKLETRDINEAIKQAIEFEKEAKSEEYLKKKETSKVQEKAKEAQTTTRPFLVINAIARYIGWMNGEGVPAHEHRERSQEHIKDVERAMKLFVVCMKENGYDLRHITVEEIDNDLVGKVFSFLEKKGYAARTFNKLIGYYTSFLSWYANEYDLPMRNYFERVKRKNLTPRPEAITAEEYFALLKRITPENGIKVYKDGVSPSRNIYRPWLADGFRLALETGRRREEVINLKWNNIVLSKGIPIYITTEDFKVNRIQNRTSEAEKKFIHIPITESLSRLLKDLGSDQNIGTDRYILAPGIKISRNKIMADVLSRGFSHFYDQLETGKKLTFKCLRKTYITSLELFMGSGHTRAITGHTDDQVIEQNYLDKKEIAKAAQSFSVFSKETERQDELKEIRTEHKQDKTIEKEV